MPGSSTQEYVPGFLYERPHIRWFGVHRQGARLYVSHVEQVGDQGSHPIGLCVDYPVELANLGGVQWHGGVQQCHDGALDGGQGSA